jgi:hypothetical protein
MGTSFFNALHVCSAMSCTNLAAENLPKVGCISLRPHYKTSAHLQCVLGFSSAHPRLHELPKAGVILIIYMACQHPITFSPCSVHAMWWLVDGFMADGQNLIYIASAKSNVDLLIECGLSVRQSCRLLLAFRRSNSFLQKYYHNSIPFAWENEMMNYQILAQFACINERFTACHSQSTWRQER